MQGMRNKATLLRLIPKLKEKSPHLHAGFGGTFVRCY
jgi:hypothetical protein